LSALDATAAAAGTPLLAVRDLQTHFPTSAGPARVVDGISFEVDRGEIVALVGESGGGKTMTALSILGLVPPPGRIVAGSVRFEGAELLGLPPAARRSLCGRQMGLVLQEAQSALNPVLSCGDQLEETLRLHRGLGRREARRAAVALLAQVHLPDPERAARAHPHELSGGMAQRVLLALALAPAPKLLIADEPTSGLDLTIQAQILALLGEQQRRLGMAVLWITHDLGVVAQVAHRLAVVYAGRIVEMGPPATVLRRPLHPYTAALLRSRPGLGPSRRRLAAIPGTVPRPAELPAHCRFQSRCTHRIPLCACEDPPPRAPEPDREIRCFVDLHPAAGPDPGPGVGGCLDP
jgi:oligopeptide/dipeptide ABC transporter ATP-binding protein